MTRRTPLSVAGRRVAGVRIGQRGRVTGRVAGSDHEAPRTVRKTFGARRVSSWKEAQSGQEGAEQRVRRRIAGEGVRVASGAPSSK